MNKARAVWKIITRVCNIGLLGYLSYLIVVLMWRIGAAQATMGLKAEYLVVALVILVLCLQNIWDDAWDIYAVNKQPAKLSPQEPAQPVDEVTPPAEESYEDPEEAEF